MSTGAAGRCAERRAERVAARAAAEDEVPANGLEDANENEEALEVPNAAMGEQACCHPICVFVAWQKGRGMCVGCWAPRAPG